MPRRTVVATAASIVCVALTAGAAEKAGDWPRFRGPTGLGVSTEKGFPLRWGPSEGIVWKTELPGAGTSSPILIGDRIFVTCYSGFGVPGQDRGSPDRLERRVVCLGRRDGKILWASKVASKLPEQEKIREEHGWASSTPVADSQRVYAFFGKSGVFALSHDGKELWHADVGSELNGWGSAASPILAGDLVIVNASVESESLVALDAKTGKEAWRAGGIKESWNTPIVVPAAGGRKVVVLAIAGKVLGFDAASGKQLWSCDTDIGWYMVPCVVAGEGLVCAIGGRSGTAALGIRTGGEGDVTASHRLWTGEKGSNVSSPILHAGHLYWMSDTRETAYCAVAKTGEIVYEEKVPRAGGVYAAPVLVEGRLYYLARDGRTHVLAAKPEYELLAVNEIGERGTFNAGLVPAGGRFYLRSNRYLYAIGSK